MNYNLFYNLKINNYQIINNIINSINIIPSEKLEESYKKFLIAKYGDFLYEISKQDFKDMNVKELNISKILSDEMKFIRIIPLIGENFIYNEEKYFIITFKGLHYYNFLIYNSNGNNINSLHTI